MVPDNSLYLNDDNLWRAKEEAAKYLVDLGIEKERIKTIGYGKEMPLDNGHDEAAWAKKGRPHFVIFPPIKN